ncbi:hypothetical protein B0H10DRAFT_1881293 [Mycena sp. CBHHK59/15]|nr:hypothetical protein B0H10DRAFT_1881293 [Mycena sp. CBHHK59/15]
MDWTGMRRDAFTPSMLFALCLALLSCTQVAVFALPTWEGLNSRTSMTSLVPSASYIEVLGPDWVIKSQSHLSSHVLGEPGNLTAVPIAQLRNPPLFSLGLDQLWQYRNETTIYPVNILNTTLTPDVPPLQLALGGKRSGLVTGGKWLWRGTMLHYNLGPNDNGGIFYACPTEGGALGLFMFLQPSPTPPGCNIVTLHSFSRRNRNAG